MRSLRHTVALSYVTLVLVTTGVSAFAAMQFTRLGNQVNRVMEENYRSVLAAENMVKALERQEQARLAQQAGTGAPAGTFEQQREAFERWFIEARSSAVLPTEPLLLDSISTAYQAYLVAATLSFGAPPGAPGASQTERLVARLRTLNLRLLDVNQEAMVQKRIQAERMARRASTAVGVIAFVAFGLSALLATWFTRRIVRPIEQLTRTVSQIGRGRLNLKVDVSTDDELSMLGREFNRMTARLQQYEALNIQQLVAEKQKSESLVETMPNPVIVTDEAGRVLMLNQAASELFALTDESWHEQPVASIVGDEALRATLLSPSEDAEATLEVAGARGVQHFRPRRHLLHDPDGHVALRVTLLEDVTHFKQLDRLKSDFLAAVSHELRTPLASLGMAADLLLAGSVGALADDQRDLLATIKADQVRLKKLVQNLLDLARLESGVYAPRYEPIEPARLADEALASLRLLFREKGVALVGEVPESLPTLYGDAQHLGWVVTNLAGNALRHTQAGGEVRITATLKAGQITFDVADTGTGLPEDALETVFEAFVQLRTPGQPTPGSLGLGLSLARRVVEAHGGTIRAANRPGGGSVFTFDLPLPPPPHDV